MNENRLPYGLTRTGHVARVLMLARFWQDGDAVSFLWNWWNPLAWPVFTLILLVGLVMHGIEILKRDNLSDLGFCMSKWWRERKDERVFLSPFTWLTREVKP